MKKYALKDVALIAEYNFTLGGAQRMLAAISKRMKKPIYLPFSKDKPLRLIINSWKRLIVWRFYRFVLRCVFPIYESRMFFEYLLKKNTHIHFIIRNGNCLFYKVT